MKDNLHAGGDHSDPTSSIAGIAELAEDIKKQLRDIGTDELRINTDNNPISALWWNNRGEPNNGEVLYVGTDAENDLFLKVDDSSGVHVSIWESHGEMTRALLEVVRNLVIERMKERICSECGRPVFEGFIVFGGQEYYCSEGCLNRHYSPEQWAEMCKGPEGKEDVGNDECYWTEWWEA